MHSLVDDDKPARHAGVGIVAEQGVWTSLKTGANKEAAREVGKLIAKLAKDKRALKRPSSIAVVICTTAASRNWLKVLAKAD